MQMTSADVQNSQQSDAVVCLIQHHHLLIKVAIELLLGYHFSNVVLNENVVIVVLVANIRYQHKW